MTSRMTSQYSWRGPQATSGLPPHLLRRVVERMHEFGSNLDLQTLAAETGYSRRHFLPMFHASTGVPPHRYLLHLRLERAKELIRLPHTSLIDVAAACELTEILQHVFAHCGAVVGEREIVGSRTILQRFDQIDYLPRFLRRGLDGERGELAVSILPRPFAHVSLIECTRPLSKAVHLAGWVVIQKSDLPSGLIECAQHDVPVVSRRTARRPIQNRNGPRRPYRCT
jgi:AraC-like DNA-binding protein